MLVRLLAILALSCSSVIAAHADAPRLADAQAQKAATKCSKTVAQATAKLVAAKLKSLDACSTAVLGCIQVKPTDAACLAKAQTKCAKALLSGVPQAEVGAAAKIVKSCGAPLRPADLLAADGLGIGARAAACKSDFGLDVCRGLPTLAQCLAAESSRSAERVFATEQPRAHELIEQVVTPLPLTYLPAYPGCQDCSQAPSGTVGKAVAACGGTLTKAGRAFAGAVSKGIGGCLDKVFTCLQTKPGDAKCVGKATAACDAAVAKLATAAAKLRGAADKRCADAGLLPFATLATAAALNLDALADDCAALGVGPLASLDDYVTCLRRQHECAAADVLRATLPRTSELVDADALGAATALLDPATCPPTSPSAAKAGRDGRALPFFGILRWLEMTKKVGGGPGVKATTVASTKPSTSPGAVKRVTFPQGPPGRFVPGSTRVLKVAWSPLQKSRAARAGAAAPQTLVVAVSRGDLVVEDHLEIPLDDVAAGDGSGEVDVEIDYDAAPPTCVFDLEFAIAENGEVSDYTVLEQVSDTVAPPTATPVAVATATPQTTNASTATPTIATTATPTVTTTATATGATTATPTSATATPSPTPSPGPGVVFAYALTTTDDTVAPGGTTAFTLTVTNLTNATQSASMNFTVPNSTSFGGFGAGSVRPVTFSNVAAGASASAIIPLTVASGGSAPPDGTTVTLTCNDPARGASVTRTVTTDASPAARLTVTAGAASVAPGGAITYALAFHNVDAGPLAGAELVVDVPPGASFLAAEGGVVPSGDDKVHFTLGALAGNTAGRRTVTVAADAGTGGPLVLAAEVRDGSGLAIAHASVATAVYAAPAFAYTLTTIDDATAPGRTVLFRVTGTNLTNASQSATLQFRVPDFGSYGGFGAGSIRSFTLSNVAPGASQSALLPITLGTGGSAPPDGTIVDLAVQDVARGTAIARAVVVDATPAAKLVATTSEGTVGPTGTFSYTLAYANPAIAPLADVELAVRVPTGATFVAADDAVAPDADGVVRWQLGTLAGNASGERRVTLAAAGGTAPRLVEAVLRNATTGEIVTQASAATIVQATPAFSYALTTTDDAVAPGGTALYRVTITNLTNATQDASLLFRVPDFTSYGGFGAGSVRTVAFSGVAAGASQSAELPLTVTSGGSAPPEGTLIALGVDDAARGAIVSRAVVVRTTPPVELAVATNAGTVAPGAPFTYTLAYANPRSTSLGDVDLGVRIPAGATFVAGEGGVTADADGVVRFALGSVAGNGGGTRTVTFAAAAGTRGPLVVEADVRDGASGEVLARASGATALYANPAFAYALTSNDDDPVAPGRVATFVLTATNRTNAPQNAALLFRVPDYTAFGGFGAGSVRTVSFASVPAGGSASAVIPLAVASGGGAPPDGSLIQLALDDTDRGGWLARTVEARTVPRAEVKLATAQGTVAPGGALSYTLSFHNTQAGALVGATLEMPVPAGAAFASADGGVTPDADGIVRFALGSLAGNAAGSRVVTLTADAGATTPVLVEATLRDAAGAILGRASASTPVYATPLFSYALTIASDTIAPGQTASFALELTNLTNTPQSASVQFRVPDFTAFGGFGAGSIRTVTFSNVAAGGAQLQTINLVVGSGGSAPPAGTLIDLTTTDVDRGAAVAKTIVVN